MTDNISNSEDNLKSTFRDLIKDVDDIDINYITVKNIYERLMNNLELAEGHINNSNYLRTKAKNGYNEYKTKKSVKNSIEEQKVVPIELMQKLTDAYNHLEEERMWERMKIQPIFIFVIKLYNAYMTTKSFEIDKAINEGFERRQEQWMELVKDNTKTMFTNVDGKFDNMRDMFIQMNNSIKEFENRIIRLELINEITAKKIVPVDTDLLSNNDTKNMMNDYIEDKEDEKK